MHTLKRYNDWRRKARGVGYLASGLGFLLGLLLTLAGASAAESSREGEALACPSGQTTWLRGRATAGVGLLARFDGVVVGGGSAGADGAWAIPITVRERPGVYPVAVTERQEGSLVAAFRCYVDLPLGASPTATLTPWPTTLPASPLPASPTPILSLTTMPTGEPEPTIVPSATATEGAPAPSATLEPSPSALLPQESAPIALLAIQADDPTEPGLFEYLLLENRSALPQPLAGWRLSHQQTGESYTFPDVTLPPGEPLVLWSGPGEDDPASATLFWPATQPRWVPGQSAQLISPAGQVVSTLSVPPDPAALAAAYLRGVALS